jgi:hypothetical protein
MTARPGAAGARARPTGLTLVATSSPRFDYGQPPTTDRWRRPLLDRGPRRTQGHEVPSPRISAWHRRRTAEPARAAPGTPAPQTEPSAQLRTPTPHADLNRGRDRRCWRPPAQIPACASNALGSCLGFWRQSASWAKDVGCGPEVATARRRGASAPTSSGIAGCDAVAP